MYEFILQQWRHGRFTEATVRSYAPKYINDEQVEQILGTKQITRP